MIKNTEYKEETAYLQLIDDIEKDGEDDEGRNGKVRCIFGASMRFKLKDNLKISTKYVVLPKFLSKSLLNRKKSDKEASHVIF